jgi:hypothetical protein
MSGGGTQRAPDPGCDWVGADWFRAETFRVPPRATAGGGRGRCGGGFTPAVDEAGGQSFNRIARGAQGSGGAESSRVESELGEVARAALGIGSGAASLRPYLGRLRQFVEFDDGFAGAAVGAGDLDGVAAGRE